MRYHTLTLVLCLLLSSATGSWAAPTEPVTSASLGKMLFDAEFHVDQWNQAQADFAGQVEQWSASEHRGQEFLNNDGGAGSTLERRIDVPAGQSVGVAIGHGWRLGRGAGRAEFALSDGTNALLVRVTQSGGPEKYQVVRDIDGQRTPIGAVASDYVDMPSQVGWDVLSSVVRLSFDPAKGTVTVARDGDVAETFDAGMPDGFAPDRVIIRDASEGSEQLRLTFARAYANGVDPHVGFAGVVLPFGGSFIEGNAIDTTVQFDWNAGGERDVTLNLELIDESGDLTAVVGPLNSEHTASSGQRLPIDPGTDLAPGLYRLTGTATVAADGAPTITKPIDARFAILSKELAERDGIPVYMGMMPSLYPVLPYERWHEAFEFMDQLGVRHVRAMGGWGRFEPEEGVFDWTENDLQVGLAQKHGMETMMCLSYYGADWATEKTKGQLARSPEGRALWVSNFAIPMMQRYGDRITDWQIWNEPDAFWNDDPEQSRGFARAFGSPANYYDLFVRTYDAKEELNPDLRVMASLASGNQPALTNMLFDRGLGERFDGIVIHTYGNHHRHLLNARQIMAERGHPGKPILVGETGLPTPPTPAGERRQAAKVANIYLATATVENVLGVDYFTLTDMAAEGTFGLVDHRLQPQPGSVAYFTVAHLLAGATGGVAEEIGTLRTFRIERAGQPPLLAMVATDGTVRRVDLRTEANTLPSWNLMGRRTDLEVRDGMASVEVGDEFVLIEGDASVEPGGRLAINPVWTVDRQNPDGKPQLAVAIDGGPAANTIVDVAVTMTDTDGNVLELPKREWQMQQGANVVNFAKPKSVVFGTLYDVQASVTPRDADVETMSTRHTLEFTPARRVTDEQADALRMPDSLTTIKLGPGDFTAMRGGVYNGADDSSATIAFGWTSDDLVLWIEQVDDVHMPVNATNPWGFDGPQLAIDPRYERSPSATYLEINFGLSPEGPIADVKDQPHFTADLAAERDEAAKKTYYRLKVPMSQLQAAAQPGTPMGVALILNDNDGNGREGWLSFGAGIGAEKNPALYREILLAR